MHYTCICMCRAGLLCRSLVKNSLKHKLIWPIVGKEFYQKLFLGFTIPLQLTRGNLTRPDLKGYESCMLQVFVLLCSYFRQFLVSGHLMFGWKVAWGWCDVLKFVNGQPVGTSFSRFTHSLKEYLPLSAGIHLTCIHTVRWARNKLETWYHF